MAGRNKSKRADYFSHDVDASSDEKIIYLESLFGFKGYAVYFKFLERMARTDGFKIQWNEIKIAIYASEFGISVTEIEQIVSECCRKEIKAFKIEKDLLFSPGLLKRMIPLIEKREYNREKYKDKKLNDNKKLKKSVTDKPISVAEIPQRKGKERKVKNKGKERKELFDLFWESYPSGHKVGKKKCLIIWLKNKIPDIDIIINALNVQKQSKQWQEENGKYIPHPSTWLSQGRWEDELEIKKEQQLSDTGMNTARMLDNLELK